MMPTKDFKFYVKAVEDKGSFEGMAAVYGNVDLGGDIIEPGAFTQTIKGKGGKVPLLWQHDQREPIGMGTLRDSKEGLLITGQLVLESDVARKALGLMKAEVLKGLSIGYDTVVSEYDKARDVRKLKEVKLWEVSLVTFPMNPKAQVTAVKSRIEELDSLIRMQLDEVRRGGSLCQETKDQLIRMQNRISALIDLDEDPDRPAAPPHFSEPDLHSLMNFIQEMVN